MSGWLAACAEKDRGAVGRLVDSLDAGARVRVVEGPDELRYQVATSEPGTYEVVVGPLDENVSDVNLAAAVANDGNARRVVLAAREASGSLRSRAARAGIDLVLDLEEFDKAPVPASRPAAGGHPTETEGPRGAAQAAARPGEGSRRAPVLVFCSGRGGVGKTALSAGAAAIAARWGLRVRLLDLDLSCGNAYSCFGLGGGGDLACLGGGATTEALSRVFVPASPGVSLAGPCARPEMAEVAAPHAGELIERAAHECDLVVVDTSTTFSEAVAQAAQRADRLLLVSDGRQGSLSAVARMSGLAVRLGVARTRMARLENRADPRARPDLSSGRAEAGLEAARCYQVVDGGREVADYLSSGRVGELCEPGYPFADSLAATLAQLMAELGCLPECEEARSAYESPRQQRRWPLFGSRREAR